MRRIYCMDCGKPSPTPPEDVALGLIPRRVCGKSTRELICDSCGKDIPFGVDVVAESIPRDMDSWEGGYLR